MMTLVYILMVNNAPIYMAPMARAAEILTFIWPRMWHGHGTEAVLCGTEPIIVKSRHHMDQVSRLHRDYGSRLV